MALTTITILVCLSSAVALATAMANKRIAEAAKEAQSKEGFLGVPLGCIWGILGPLIVAAWTWHSIVTEDIRYAIIAWVPFLANLIVKLAVCESKKKSAQPGVRYSQSRWEI